MELVANYTKQNQKVTKQSASLYQKQLFFKRPFSKQKLKRITIRNQCTQHAGKTKRLPNTCVLLYKPTIFGNF